MCSVLELASANFDREHGSILAPMTRLEGDRFPRRYLLSDPHARCLVQRGVKSPGCIPIICSRL